MKIASLLVVFVLVSVGLSQPAAAKCPVDSVLSGTVCIDKYEASVWYAPPTETKLIDKIRDGSATLTDLTSDRAVAAGVGQRGTNGPDYGPGCQETGNGCVDYYAVSIAGVRPSAYMTWFQTAAAARNSYKRLPTNQEWQVAAFGTPDGLPCNVSSASASFTGAAVACISDVGAFDMVGNLYEWVADWVPLSTACVASLFGTSDYNCLAGASTVAGPAALIRGGDYTNGAGDGVFNIYGGDLVTFTSFGIGFRAVR